MYDKLKAFRCILLCESFMADIINILNNEAKRRGENIDFGFGSELQKLQQLDRVLSATLPRGADKNCVLQVKNALKHVSVPKQTPAQYISTLLNILPYAKLCMPEQLGLVIDSVSTGLLEKCGDAICGEMLADVEQYADRYLSAVFKDYEPIKEDAA